MKTMMVVAMMTMLGCGGSNAALQARVAAAEMRQADLKAQIDQLKNDEDICASAMAKVRSVEASLQEQADKAWTAIKEKEASVEPSVKKSAGDGIDSVEIVVKDAATKAMNLGKQWAADHNFSSK